MEWVEIRGETLEQAKEQALDQLGVAIEDAEFEIVQVPESRWLGLKKTEARVRARVRPTQPRAKREGRPRKGRKGDDAKSRSQSSRGRSNANGADAKSAKAPAARAGTAASDTGRTESATKSRGGGRDQTPAAAASTPAAAPAQSGSGDAGSQDRSSGSDGDRGRSRPKKQKERAVSDQTREELVPVDEQTELVEGFLTGVLQGFDLDGTVSTSVVDGDVQADIAGTNLGLLIGPKGGTIRALQEVTRAAAQRHADGRDTHRINVDVAGYRERRREALAEFARRQAAIVQDEGRRVALEPMGSADRKAVHDAVLDIDGVRSISEGDDPRRRVVLLPDS